jgi:malate permease and related proteins
MFLTILIKITLPVFILIGAGVILDRTMKLDVLTLTRLSFNVFLPALVFIKTYDAGLSPEIFGIVTVINLVHTALIFGASWLLFSLSEFRSHRPVLTLAGILPNAGNYGIPLATLAYGAGGANVMAIIVMLQIVVTVTAGIFVIDSGKSNWREVILGFIKIPLLWSCIAALGLVALKVELPTPLRVSMDYLANGLVPLALVTLGIQLSRSHFGGHARSLPIVTFFRLALSPLLAWGLVKIWTILFSVNLGVAGQVLVIGAGMPVAVNVFILASEYDQDSELASQTILWTTLLSAVTLTAWLAVL